MNLFHKKLQLNFPFCGISRVLHFCALSLPLILPSLTSCIDEKILPDTPSPSPSSQGSYEIIDLPGCFSINLISTASGSTRADDPTVPGDYNKDTNPDSFHDGVSEEYSIALGPDHHFILVYKSNYTDQEDKYPLAIIPLTIENVPPLHGEKNDNLTLTISKIIASSKLAGQLTTKDAVKDFLSGKDFFALINFDKSLVHITNTNSETKEPTYATTTELLETITKDKLFTTQLKDYKITLPILKDGENKNVDYFTMTNSVYLDRSNANKLFGQTIDETQVFDTEDQAMTAADNGNFTITLYVERIAAKVTVEFPNDQNGKILIKQGSYQVKLFKNLTNDGTYDYEYESKDWTATVVGYGVNGLEPTEYLIKKIGAVNYYGNWSWNDFFKNRSYWADDINYTIKGNVSKYPNQYRRALENEAIRGYHIQDDGYNVDGTLKGFSKKNSDYVLNYVSLQDILAKEQTMYPLENTYNDTDISSYLGDRGYFSAGTHLLLACRLNIKGLKEDADLYRDQNGYFYDNRETLLETKLEIMQNKILSGGNSGIRVYYADWYNHNYFRKSDLVTVSWEPDAKLKISEEGKLREVTQEDLTLIPAEMAGGDGQLLIAPRYKDVEYFIGTELENTSLSIKDKNGKIIEGSSYNRVISLFHKVLGAVDHFNEGYMYYAAPIVHATNSIENAAWNKLGDYGTVRNNWYAFTIEGVTSPGTPVDQIEQPIIPMMDVTRNYLNVTVNVADWHSLPEQTAPLFPLL